MTHWTNKEENQPFPGGFGFFIVVIFDASLEHSCWKLSVKGESFKNICIATWEIIPFLELLDKLTLLIFCQKVLWSYPNSKTKEDPTYKQNNFEKKQNVCCQIRTILSIYQSICLLFIYISIYLNHFLYPYTYMSVYTHTHTHTHTHSYYFHYKFFTRYKIPI
jgi:hypothetical protein